MRKNYLLFLMFFAFPIHAEVGLGWLGGSKQISLEFKSKDSPYSIAISGTVTRSESPNYQLYPSNNGRSNEENYTNLTGLSQLYFIRNVVLYSSKTKNFVLKTSPFISLGYAYQKTEHVENTIYNDPSMAYENYSFRNTSVTHTGNLDIGFRPELLFFKRLSLLFYLGASGHVNYRILGHNPDVYNTDYSVHFFGDLVNSSGSNAAVLSSISVMYWFGAGK